MGRETNLNNSTAQLAAHGAVALGIRQIFVQGINVATGVVLARELEPGEFALWGIMTLFLVFFSSFADAGLGASLVRQPGKPEEKDYAAIFSLQQAIALAFSTLIWFLSPWLAVLYGLGDSGTWLFRCIGVSLLLTSLMMIPQARLERRMAFNKLAVVEISQAVTYNASAVILAIMGIGPVGFGVALLLRSVVGTALAYLVDPWPLRLFWDWQRIQPHLAFGLSFLGSKLTNLMKDMVVPLFIAVNLGTAAAGYINWATMVMNYPLLVVVVLQRLYLPLFARFTDDMSQFRKVLTLIVSLLAWGVYTITALIFVFKDQLTSSVFGTQWSEALILFVPFTVISVLLTPTIVAMSAMNALGKPREVFILTLTWLILTWLLGTTFTSSFGWQAWGWANLLTNLPNLWLLWRLEKICGISWVKVLWFPGMVSLAGAVAGAAIAFWAPWVIALCIGFLVSVALYARPLRVAIALIKNR